MDPGEIKACVPVASAARAASAHRSDRIRSEFLARVNAHRTSRGLAALAPSPLLQAAAQLHAASMADNGYFGHVDLQGRTAGRRIREIQPLYTGIVRENLYYCTECLESDSAVADHAVTSLMASPGHRDNLLARDVVTMDAGVAIGPNGIVIVQMLARCDEYGIR